MCCLGNFSLKIPSKKKIMGKRFKLNEVLGLLKFFGQLLDTFFCKIKDLVKQVTKVYSRLRFSS